MRQLAYAALTVGLLAAFAAPAHATGELILGDSFGVGVKIASGHAGPARLSQFIRNDQILSQISLVPNGATAILVLGTNDSVGSVKGLEKYIDNIVQAVQQRGIRLVWVGPPCVLKPWDHNSRDLDAMLGQRLASTSVKYISIRNDADLCSGKYTGGDGVHFNLTGYSLVWHKARLAAGLPDSEDRTQVATAPATKPVQPGKSDMVALSSVQVDAQKIRRPRVYMPPPEPPRPPANEPGFLSFLFRRLN